MADCTQYLELISARLDGELSPEEEKRLQAHLDQCPSCRALLADLTAIYHETSRPLEDVPAGFADRVMRRIESDASARAEQKRQRRQWRMVAAMAAALTLVIWAVGPLDPADLLVKGDPAQTPAVSAQVLPDARLAEPDPASLPQSYAVQAENLPSEPDTPFVLSGALPGQLEGYPSHTLEDGSLAVSLPADDFRQLAEALFSLGMTGSPEDADGLETVWILVVPQS